MEPSIREHIASFHHIFWDIRKGDSNIIIQAVYDHNGNISTRNGTQRKGGIRSFGILESVLSIVAKGVEYERRVVEVRDSPFMW